MEAKKEDNLIRVEFECCTVPLYYTSTSKDYITWGKENAYPNFLMFLDKRNSYHGMIIQAKSEYIYGKGLVYDKDELTMLEQAKYDAFLSRANDTEDWNDIFRKNCKPGEIFNGIALQVVWKINGKPDVFSMNPGHFRTNKNGSKYYYCEAWNYYNENGVLCQNPSPEKHESWRVFDKFDPNVRTGAQILFYKAPFLSLEEYGHLYPEPNYIQIIQDIETDIEITNFHYNGLKNGMSASSIVSLFNGEPEPAEMKKIAAKFKNKHTGSNNAGGFILNFVDKGGTPADIKNLTMSDLDKMFEVLGKRLQQNIFSGHRFDPILGGIMQEGQLGGAKEILEKWDKFLKTYIQHRQEMHLGIIRMFGGISGVNLSKLEVKQLTPIREELPIDQITVDILGADVVRKYLAKRYDINVEDSETEVSKMEALPVNENVKALTGRQRGAIQSIVNQYKKKKIQYAEAQHLIMGYGLGQDYIDIVLGKQQGFSEQVDAMLQAFEACAIDDVEGEVVSEHFFHKGTEVHEFAYKQAFASTAASQVLELIKGNPNITNEQIAKQLGLEVDQINEIINSLIEKELMVDTAAGLSITPKGLATKPAEIEYETVTVYEYVTRPDVPEANTSRPFCKRLLAMSRNGKRWTKDAIDNITNQFNEDAWSYRGGFYTNPNTQKTTPYCRHVWKGVTKVRRKS